MPIQAACTCGHTFHAPSKFAGKKVKCPKCKEPLLVPATSASGGAAKTAATKAAVIAVACTCGKKLQVKAALAGKQVKCPSCGEAVAVKGPPAKAKQDDDSPMNHLFAEAGLADSESRGRKCPECKAPMKTEAIICIECGYNENLGRKMEIKRPVTAKERVKKAAQRNPDPAAAGKKKNKARPLLLLIGLAAVAVAIVLVVKSGS